MSEDFSRRKVIRNLGTLAGGLTAAIVLPERWTKPIIDTMITPANAAYSTFCQNGTLYYGGNVASVPNSPSCPQTSSTPPTTS